MKHRSIIDNPIYKKPLIAHLFDYCLLKANHKDNEIIWNNKTIIVKRGSFITGRKAISIDTGLSEQNIRTGLKTLYNLKMLQKSTSKSTSKFTYLTICNYDNYQNFNLTSNHQTNQQVTSKQPASNQQVTTNKNDNKEKNDKNGKNINISFEKFWNLYNYKVGSKIKVLKKWESLTDLDRGMIMEHLPHYVKSTPDKQYRKHPATYLNNQGWFDEIVAGNNGSGEFRLDSTGKFYVGYCGKCNKSDFYEQGELSGDSRCCNDKINNRRITNGILQIN